MSDQPHTRRTLLPLLLLLGGLLGAGPFVPGTLAAGEPSTPAPVFDVPGLAGLLGLALAVAALAGIALSRRGRGPAAADGRPEPPPPDGRQVDPLLAALRGPAAYAPDDLDVRLGARTSVGSASTAGDGPRWVRRIDRHRQDGSGPERHDPTGGWQAVADAERSVG